MTERLEEAKKLYEDGEYQSVLDILKEIDPVALSDLDLVKEYALLTALSAAHLITPEHFLQENSYGAVALAYLSTLAKTAGDSKEVCDFFDRICTAIFERLGSFVDDYISKINNDDDLTSIYFELFSERILDLIESLAASVKAYLPSTDLVFPYILSCHTVFEMRRDLAVFTRGKETASRIPWMPGLTLTVSQVHLRETMYDMIFATNLMELSVLDENNDCFVKDTFLLRAKALLNLYCTRLNARCLSAGGDMNISLFQDNREETYEKLCSLEKRIQRYEPDYQKPPVTRYAITPPAQQSGGGCYVATAVYGSYDCPEVWTLRRYRDYSLSKTWYGRAFIRTYYAISPTVVKWFGNSSWFNKLWKGKLDSLVKKLQTSGFSDTPYEDINW